MANLPPMSVTEATTKRISYRRFLNKPVSEQDVRSILDKARFAPSGGNTQPWHCYVLAGEAKAKLTKAILENAAKPSKAEYRMYPGKEDMPKDMFDLYMKRRRTLASEMYRLMGISYNDKKGRAEAMMKNSAPIFAPGLGALFIFSSSWVLNQSAVRQMIATSAVAFWETGAPTPFPWAE